MSIFSQLFTEEEIRERLKQVLVDQFKEDLGDEMLVIPSEVRSYIYRAIEDAIDDFKAELVEKVLDVVLDNLKEELSKVDVLKLIADSYKNLK